MTKEEFREGIIKVLKDPDTALVNIEPFIEEFDAKTDTLATLTAEKENSDKRIRDLQDTNMKLFLRASAEPEKEEEDEQKSIDDMSLDEYLAYCNDENAKGEE